MDFTLDTYKKLLKALKERGYCFKTFLEYLEEDKPSPGSMNHLIVILRNDVDLLPENSLRFAKIQADMGIKASYYFRAVKESWDEKIIIEIAEMGHEVGYHYETMDTSKGNIDKAWDQFRHHLNKLRELIDVKTICMHGSPRSKYDNKDIWKKYDYRSLDIIGEPYYDVNFDKVFYLTDTGRMWDGWQSSVRDKVSQQKEWINEGLIFHSTQDIINAIFESKLTSQIMFTFHPQRWTDNPFLWIKERILQTAKNQVKKILISKK